MILTSEHAIEVFTAYLLDTAVQPFKTALLDATGKICKAVNGNRQVLHHVLLAPIQQRGKSSCFLVPVGEMVTDDHSGENIGYFVRSILNRLPENAVKRLRRVGTDDSWPNVHAIFTLTPGMSVSIFLRLSFDVFQGGEPSLELMRAIFPGYCFSHFSKNWKTDLRKAYPDSMFHNAPHLRAVVRSALKAMTTIADTKDLQKHINAFLMLLLSKFETKGLTDAVQLLCNDDPVDNEVLEDINDDFQAEDPEFAALYRDSPFYQLFNAEAERIKENNTSSSKRKLNEFFNEELATKILSHYLPYLPFWTLFIPRLHHPTAERSNNARVELHFNHKKSHLVSSERQISRLGDILVGRYSEFHASELECLLNEVDADKFESSRRTNQPRKKNVFSTPSQGTSQEASLSQQEEQWSKPRRSKVTDLPKRK